MKKKVWLVVPLGLAAAVLAAIYGVRLWYSGATVESRQRLLERASPNQSAWQIVQEKPLADCLVTAAISDNRRAALSVFRERGSGYRHQRSLWLTEDSIFLEDLILDAGEGAASGYQLLWYPGASAYAEVIYTVDGVEQPPLHLDTPQPEIFLLPYPAPDFSVQVTYYAADGTPAA